MSFKNKSKYLIMRHVSKSKIFSEKTTVRIMNPNDRPSRVADVVGDGNCLFRALAFYFAGSDIEHSRVRECVISKSFI